MINYEHRGLAVSGGTTRLDTTSILPDGLSRRREIELYREIISDRGEFRYRFGEVGKHEYLASRAEEVQGHVGDPPIARVVMSFSIDQTRRPVVVTYSLPPDEGDSLSLEVLRDIVRAARFVLGRDASTLPGVSKQYIDRYLWRQGEIEDPEEMLKLALV